MITRKTNNQYRNANFLKKYSKMFLKFLKKQKNDLEGENIIIVGLITLI